jgi:hypothetical protein
MPCLKLCKSTHIHLFQKRADSDFVKRVEFAMSLKQEEGRHTRKSLSEDELEIYDLLASALGSHRWGCSSI